MKLIHFERLICGVGFFLSVWSFIEAFLLEESRVGCWAFTCATLWAAYWCNSEAFNIAKNQLEVKLR